MSKLIQLIDLSKLSKIQLIRKINTLEGEKTVLEDTIKDELYKTFMDKLKEPLELDRLRKDNKNLRAKVKTLKQIIKGDNDAG